MSFAALAWAAKQRPGNLAAKMVLLGLANFADEHGCAYPSTAALAEFGDMDHKTATSALDRLLELKIIEDSGERAGRTKQIKVYRLKLESLPETEAYQKRKPTVFSVKDPQKRGTDTVRTQLPKKDKPSLDKRATKIPADFVPVLSGKTASVVAGWPPGKLPIVVEHFIDHHTAKGTLSYDWQASFRTWVKNDTKWEPKIGRPNTLRGNRPSPALDMARRGAALEALEQDAATNRGTWNPVPASLTSGP